MSTHEYVHMPQDDRAQIEQIEREYGTEGKGLTHGVQKDAIQNGFGARSVKSEAKACKTWSMTFELLKIKGKQSLVFWDEGTVGLTGDVLASAEINDRTADGSLGPEQRLGRFLTRFVSGGNLGPGSFGRGKLIFQAGSNSTNILIDSLREDGTYVALDRRIIGGQLKQPAMPYEAAEAREFIVHQTGGVLRPLKTTGTRISVLDVKEEVIEAFKHSFSNTHNVYRASFAHMIEDTWWEILHRFDAKFFLRHGDDKKQVVITNPLSDILSAKDGQDGIRVHAKKNLVLTTGGKQYRIKELRLVVMPSPLENGFRDIWVQRKRMKVGSLFRVPPSHHKITKRLAGYVVLEPELEDLVEQVEGLTHYSFNGQKAVIRQIRTLVLEELRKFEGKLGLVSVSEDAQARNRLLDSMKELNELASELGLVTQQDVGGRVTPVNILMRRMDLPNHDTLRVEIGDCIGPIEYELKNNLSVASTGLLRVLVKQVGADSVELLSQAVDIQPEQSETIGVPEFTLDTARFQSGKALIIQASLLKTGSTELIVRCSRTLYVGIDEPVADQKPISLSLTAHFPRAGNRRVERAEVLRRIRLRVTNNRPHEIPIDLVATVRHLENPKTGRLTTPLKILHEDKDLVLGPNQDYEVMIDDLPVSPEVFGSVFETVADVTERTCDLYAVARLARTCEQLAKPRKWKLDRISSKFYVEVDPPGYSIFSNVQNANEPSDPRQSWYDGHINKGYTFVLNDGHSAAKFVEAQGIEVLSRRYGQEQALRQAYLIAFDNQVFKGPAGEHKDVLSSGGLAPKEVAAIFEKIVGAALNQLQR